MTAKSFNKKENSILIKQLTELLDGKNAHATFDEAVKNLPANLRGVKPDKLPYSIWQLAEHIRIAQWDILEFSRNEKYQSPKWPDEYWPKNEAPESENDWENCLQQIKNDRDEFVDLLHENEDKLFVPFSYGDGQTLLREALLIADHTSYHTGEIIALRRLLGAW